MSFVQLIREILSKHPGGMTPQQLRDYIKKRHPDFYGTEAHRRNVEKRHYKDLDHALLAQIYVASRNGTGLTVDRSRKPIQLTIVPGSGDPSGFEDEDIDSENLDKLEAGVGTLYVLSTNLYTKDGQEILKIGITTGPLEARINQLYTTGVPFKFKLLKQIETKNFNELEQALHKLLNPFRLNAGREFFTSKCLPHVDQICLLHKSIQDEP